MSRELFVATIGHARRNRGMLLNLAHGGPDVELVFTFWILRDERGAILIETGFTESIGKGRGVADWVDPGEILGRIGLAPADIRTILISHLHWDHFAAPQRFPNATFVVQHDDYAYFTGPGRQEPAGAVADRASIEALDEIRAQDRLQLVDGNVRIFDDISLVRVGGHTPGLQIVVLHAADGPRVFACDASHLYENLQTRTPTSIIYNYREYQRGFASIVELSAGGHWFPGHDPAMLEGLTREAESLYRLP